MNAVLLNPEQWPTTSVAAVINELAEMNAGSATYKFMKDGKPAAAFVLLHGDDTQAYLDALDVKEKELEAQASSDVMQTHDPDC